MGDISTEPRADGCSQELVCSHTSLERELPDDFQKDLAPASAGPYTILTTTTSITTTTTTTPDNSTPTPPEPAAEAVDMAAVATIPLEVREDLIMPPSPSPSLSDGNEADNEADVSSIASFEDYSPPTPKDLQPMPQHLLPKQSFVMDDCSSEIIPLDFTESVAVVISYAYAGKAKLVEVSSGSELSSSSNSPNLSQRPVRPSRVPIAQKRRLGAMSGPPGSDFQSPSLSIALDQTRYSLRDGGRQDSWVGYDIGDYVQADDLSPRFAGSKFGEVGLSSDRVVQEGEKDASAPPLPERSNDRSRNRLSGLFMHPVASNGSSASTSPELVQMEIPQIPKPKKTFTSTITPVTDLTLTSSLSASASNTSATLPSPPPSPFWKSTTTTLARKLSLTHHTSSSSLAGLSPEEREKKSQKRKATRSGLHLSTHLNLAPHNAANAMAPSGKKLRKRRRVISGTPEETQSQTQTREEARIAAAVALSATSGMI